MPNPTLKSNDFPWVYFSKERQRNSFLSQRTVSEYSKDVFDIVVLEGFKNLND